MAKFFGEIGYGEAVETAPGVYTDQITERQYYGDILKNTMRLQDGSEIIDSMTVNNSISIVADAYANEKFFAIRYVRWMGALWEVSTVEVQSPRLVLRLGGVYNGPTPAAPVNS